MGGSRRAGRFDTSCHGVVVAVGVVIVVGAPDIADDDVTMTCGDDGIRDGSVPSHNVLVVQKRSWMFSSTLECGDSRPNELYPGNFARWWARRERSLGTLSLSEMRRG